MERRSGRRKEEERRENETKKTPRGLAGRSQIYKRRTKKLCSAVRRGHKEILKHQKQQTLLCVIEQLQLFEANTWRIPKSIKEL